MRRNLLILIVASLTACSNSSTAPLTSAPTPPPLPALSASPCQKAAPLQTKDVAAVVAKLIEVASLRAECSAGKRAAVESYDAARKAAQEFNEGLK